MSLLGSFLSVWLLLLIVAPARAHEPTDEGVRLSEVVVVGEWPVAASSQQFIPDKE